MLNNHIVTITLNPAIDRIVEVPSLTIGRHQQGRLLRRIPAGKGVNVSNALANLGVPSIATGLVGENELDEFERSMKDTQVQFQFLAVKGSTRENLTLIDSTNNIETHIRDVGPSPAAADLDRLRNKINLLVKPESIVIFSGSLPTGVGVEVESSLIELAVSKGAHVAVDGPGTLLAAVRRQKLWLIKPNMEELADMVGDPTLTQEAMINLGRELSKEIRTVIISCGSAGGYLFTKGFAMIGQVDVESATIVSTVGCGDAMLAAFVAAHVRGDDIKSSYQFALAVATAAATHATPGQFDADAVDRFVQRASVVPVGGD